MSETFASFGSAASQDTREHSIINPGRNCWRVARAERAVVLIDGSAYFGVLREALKQARSSILIIGWDFDGSIRLDPEKDECLGDLLRSCVEDNPDLTVSVLVWNLALFYTPGQTLPLLSGAKWEDHPRIEVRLDSRHPGYAAQHQKIVCIDDDIAFVGGIDLTVGRWDTPAHNPHDPRRTNPDGKGYQPVHDLQIAVQGEVAAVLGQLARHRWRVATGNELLVPRRAGAVWPAGLDPDLTGVQVAVARTIPAWKGEAAVGEVEALNRDALSAAQDIIYIEAQYFADTDVGEVLAQRLSEPDGPEILVFATQATHGIIERWIMGANRDRIARRLARMDRDGRFRIYHPCIATSHGPCEILIHSKLLIVDDTFIRIGSSNFNRRSRGLDTECDLAIEATSAGHRRAIGAIRDRLIAEHLGTDFQTLSKTCSAEGSILRALDRLNDSQRRLRPFKKVLEPGPEHVVPGTRLLDPPRPFRGLLRLFKRDKDGSE